MVRDRAAYQRGYNKAWKQARRARLIEMLGGKCVRCGAPGGLEFDHIDPSSKVLLCMPCHIAKGAGDRPGLKHGTYHVYWYWNCRCDLRNWLEGPVYRTRLWGGDSNSQPTG